MTPSEVQETISNCQKYLRSLARWQWGYLYLLESSKNLVPRTPVKVEGKPPT